MSVLAETPGALIDPFVLGSKDENDVQGYAGTPTDVNALTYDSQLDIGAAGAQFPRLQRFYVAVDSRADPFTNQPLKGTYLLNAWINDVTPPSLRLLTTRVSAGRPLIVAQAVDARRGRRPALARPQLRKALIGASAYDPFSGLALFGLPSQAPKLQARARRRAIIAASDYQEAKNIDTVGTDLYPNTAFKLNKLKVVERPAVTWIEPPANACAIKNDRLVVVAGSTTKITKVQFSRRHAPGRHDEERARRHLLRPWSTGELEKGKHTMTAVAVDRSGRKAVARRQLRVCK